MKAYLRDGVYIPIKHVKEEHEDLLKERFERLVYHKEKTCEACDYFSERPCDVCESCANFGGNLVLHRQVERNGKTFLRLPFGDLKGVQKIFGDEVEFVNKLPKIPMVKPIKFVEKLRPYQVPACKAMVKVHGGVLKSAPRTGKCVSGDTLVLTSRGLVPIKDVVPAKDGYHTADFKICTEKGWQDVVQTYRESVDRTISVRTENGFTLKGTPEHPVLALHPDLGLRWTQLSEIAVGTPIAISKWFDLPEYRVSLKRPDSKYNKVMTTSLAAFMGYCVANGNLNPRKHLGNFSFSSANEKVRRHFEALANELFPDVNAFIRKSSNKVPSVELNSKSVVRYLEANGLKFVKSKEKDIPTSVITAGKDCVQAFLEAYFSCDSYVPSSGDLQLCSASKKLIKQLQFLLLSFGVFSRYMRSKSFARNGSRIVRPYYNLFIGARSKAAFLAAFSLKKNTDSKVSWRSGRGDVVPFAGGLLGRLIDRYKVPNKYEVFKKGKKQFKLSGSKKIISSKHKLSGSLTIAKLETVATDSVALLSKRLARRIDTIKSSGFSFDKVVSIEESHEPCKVYDVVVPATESFLANGIVSHNTVMAARVVCAKKQKTLILASQRDWLENFYETFVGSDTQPPMTDASKKRVGFAKKLEDFEKYDVALATYQTFLSPKGKKLLKKIKKMFSILIVDEVQTVPATEFSLIVSQLHCRHKFGLSGTPERKDGKEWTAYKLMGPVFYETRVEKLKPRVEIVRTDFGGKVPQSWTYMIRKLETDPKRLKLIAKEAVKDVKAGHMVLIPFTRVPVIKALTQAINQLVGKKIAEPFYGGVNKEQRKTTIERARNYKCKVIVGNSRLLSTGINIPRASMLYEVTPSSNIPKAEQRFSRVCTPMEGKPQPVIKYFLDEFQLRKSCMRNEFFQVLWPKFRPVIRGDVKEALYAYMSNKKTNHHLGRGEYIGGVL